jgi:hypothetical protein
MRRYALLALCAAAIVASLLPPTLAAQIGGRIRSAVTNAAQGQQQPPAPVKPEPVAITAQVVTNYEKALGAMSRERERLSHENTPAGRYYAAQFRKEAFDRRLAEYRAKRGPDYEREQQLFARISRGDTTAIQAYTHVNEWQGQNPEVPDLEWSDQQAATAHMDSVGMQAAGYSAGEWMYLGEKIPVVAWYVSDRKMTDSAVAEMTERTGLKAAEVRAIGARRIELARAAGWPFKTDEELAAERAGEANRSQREAAAADPTKDYNACFSQEMKPIMDEADRRKAELDAARQAGDMTKLVDFANRVSAAQMAATQKCAPLQH